MSKRAAYAAIGIGTAAVIAAGIVVPHLVVEPTHAATRFAVVAGTDACGTGWPGDGGTLTSGTQTFRITNNSVGGVDVQLENPKTGAIYLEAESIGAGASQDYSVRLDAGDYRFRCLPADADAIVGATEHVGGAAHVSDATPGVVPVTRNDLIPAAKAYTSWIEGRLPILHADVTKLATDVVHGDRTAAEHDWLVGHLEYEQLGAAYGAFGDDDTAINGMPASGATALTDGDLTGFHKIEALLWTDAAMPSIVGQTNTLVSAVGHLEKTFPTAQIDPLDIGLRSHEILENALQFEVTGKSDAGSHTNLATIAANVQGTRHALAPIRGLLRTRDPELGDIDASLDQLQQLVAAYRHADGSWTPIASLTTPEREALDARMGDSLELLANVAAIADIRRTA